MPLLNFKGFRDGNAAVGVGIFGTIMDAWHRPIDDVGAAGRDKGRCGKYVFVPEG